MNKSGPQGSLHIVFANRYYRPDNAATSQLVTDLAEHLASQGHKVEVLTSRQRYNDAAANLPRREIINGVTIRRVTTSTFGRNSLPGRALDYLSFYLGFALASLSTLHRGTLLVCCTDPPLLSIPATVACFIKRARLVNWLQDLYPEVAVALGVVSGQSPLTRFLVRLRNLSLRAARNNVVLGDIMARRVRDCGVDPQRVSTVHNWSVAPRQDTTPPGSDNPLRQAWCMDHFFVVAYSGNLGKAHEIDTLLQAAEVLRAETNIRFLMIGDGHHTPTLQSRASQRGLDNILFRPYQPLELLHTSLAAADVHLVILRPEIEGCIVPSKFYGALASGRPVIFVGSRQGEIARILESTHAGVTAMTGDGDSLARAIIKLRDNPALRREMAASALDLAQHTYNRENALQQWQTLLQHIPVN